VFALTGITDGVLARGVRATDSGLELQTFVLDSALPAPVILTHQL
jgi:fructose-1,6-bisphosphatase/sedoheptulose 1,7-bisphosphatase-like protein